MTRHTAATIYYVSWLPQHLPHYRFALPKKSCLRRLLWKQCSYILHKSTSRVHIEQTLSWGTCGPKVDPSISVLTLFSFFVRHCHCRLDCTFLTVFLFSLRPGQLKVLSFLPLFFCHMSPLPLIPTILPAPPISFFPHPNPLQSLVCTCTHFFVPLFCRLCN